MGTMEYTEEQLKSLWEETGEEVFEISSKILKEETLDNKYIQLVRFFKKSDIGMNVLLGAISKRGFGIEDIEGVLVIGIILGEKIKQQELESLELNRRFDQ